MSSSRSTLSSPESMGQVLKAAPRVVPRLPAYLGVGLVFLYRYTLGVLFPGGCKYHPSCSQYAIDALRRYGLVRGIFLAGWRLLRCNPWSRGGVDYVEQQRLFR
jgi:putative membrane protein insertion efficiency factor